MTELHSDDLCPSCGQDFLLKCICEDFDSQHDMKEMEQEMIREQSHCLEPNEYADVDYGDSHDWENLDDDY